MKRYWEYVKEYTEKTQHAKVGDYVAKPEIWIGFKFLDDNGIDKLWTPEDRKKLKKVFEQCEPLDRPSFVHAVYMAFNAVKKISEMND